MFPAFFAALLQRRRYQTGMTPVERPLQAVDSHRLGNPGIGTVGIGENDDLERVRVAARGKALAP